MVSTTWGFPTMFIQKPNIASAHTSEINPIIFLFRTTEIRDFERSEEIPLQLMVRYCFYFFYSMIQMSVF